MIIDYGFSITGKSHADIGTCCQDNHKIKRLDNGWIIAAVADGVGSAAKSEIGSKIAVETVVSMCEEYMPWDYSLISIKSMMRTAYNYAFKQIVREAEKNGDPIEDYDTTLTMVIYDGHKIIYGHSGDGAIIGLNTFGDYIPITTPQKGPDKVSVIPLRAGYTSWVIDSYDEELAAVLLMTDGTLDAVFKPYLLREINRGIYIPVASFFADPICFIGDEAKLSETKNCIMDFAKGEDNFDSDRFYAAIAEIYGVRVKEHADQYIEELRLHDYPGVLMRNAQDDKTIVGLINTDLEVESREEIFYKEPNWLELREAWNRKAYPHLYKDKDKDESGNSEKEQTDKEDNDNQSCSQTTAEQSEEKPVEKPKKKSILDRIGDALS